MFVVVVQSCSAFGLGETTPPSEACLSGTTFSLLTGVLTIKTMSTAILIDLSWLKHADLPIYSILSSPLRHGCPNHSLGVCTLLGSHQHVLVQAGVVYQSLIWHEKPICFTTMPGRLQV